MEVLVKDISKILENFAPIEYAEDYDNIGLIIGSYNQKVTKILITLDITEKVIEESIYKKCNLIISFHPIFLKNSIKKLNGSTYLERLVISALKNDISIYVIHTNLDVIWQGTNSYISQILKLNRMKVLIPKIGTMKKLTTYVPVSFAKKVRNSLFDAGAGKISNYSRCSYNFDGLGSFMGNEKTKPVVGKKGKFHLEKETCINVLFPFHKLNRIKKALFKNHPYEEVPYEIYNIENINPYLGIGIIGYIEKKINESDFLFYLKKTFNLSCIKHSPFIGKKINKITMIAGAGSFGIEYALKEEAHVFISSDLKYHDFFKNENKILIVDIGHYESEQFNKNLLKDFLNKKFIHIPVYESKILTNPVQYFY
ncbi:Nif3-like dinuclear metal center hexameric protein [Blattabacterium cuenoti]|uniref:Nif3-like dinuclear metal center hexameric protein n=1 Tax=Blattabacterium cuenoti TaxID=1653831 RepID=UPI00163D174C|nr:Nif3-like dinuclear metal center hexameric protein [Blattabacterium cuenoti]